MLLNVFHWPPHMSSPSRPKFNVKDPAVAAELLRLAKASRDKKAAREAARARAGARTERVLVEGGRRLKRRRTFRSEGPCVGVTLVQCGPRGGGFNLSLVRHCMPGELKSAVHAAVKAHGHLKGTKGWKPAPVEVGITMADGSLSWRKAKKRDVVEGATLRPRYYMATIAETGPYDEAKGRYAGGSMDRW